MRIGEYQELHIQREAPQGVYLTDGQVDVLLPRAQVPPSARQGDAVKVFVLTDSEDRPIATTRRPYAAVGDFAMLTVVSVTSDGAFLDWGIDKDLFCPIREQQRPMRGRGFAACGLHFADRAVP